MPRRNSKFLAYQTDDFKDESLQKRTDDATKITKTICHEKKNTDDAFPRKVAFFMDNMMAKINLNNFVLRAGNTHGVFPTIESNVCTGWS